MFGTKSIGATIAHTPPIIVVDTSTTSRTKKKMRMAPIVTKHGKNNRPHGLINPDTHTATESAFALAMLSSPTVRIGPALLLLRRSVHLVVHAG